jgi:hypothetical protein
MNAKAKAMNSTTENMKAISNSVPLGRFGTPDEIAKVKKLKNSEEWLKGETHYELV